MDGSAAQIDDIWVGSRVTGVLQKVPVVLVAWPREFRNQVMLFARRVDHSASIDFCVLPFRRRGNLNCHHGFVIALAAQSVPKRVADAHEDVGSRVTPAICKPVSVSRAETMYWRQPSPPGGHGDLGVSSGLLHE